MGLDWAIKDGVDILSLSIDGGSYLYFRDPIAFGTFTTIGKGFFVSCAAGNEGPMPAIVVNTTLWIMTVGAKTLDRDFLAHVTLGNKTGSPMCLYIVDKEWGINRLVWFI